MSLHNGVDYVAVATMGMYTETYGSSAPANIANLFASLGLYEDAPDILIVVYYAGLLAMGMGMDL
jgi:hypothetical protein